MDRPVSRARARTFDGGDPERSTRERDNLERLVRARPPANDTALQRLKDRWELAKACGKDALAPPLQRRGQTLPEYEDACVRHRMLAFASLAPVAAFLEGALATADTWPGRGIIKP